MEAGDTFDILHSRDWKNKPPCLFKERQWVRGGDTRIWVDGEVPQTKAGADWLEQNYDALYFGFICPHETKAYPKPQFYELYQTKLPMVAGVTDGYWEEYDEWGRMCLPHLNHVVVVQPTYAEPVRAAGAKNVTVLLAPFVPEKGPYTKKEKLPLLIWPNQWKDIKGITKFLNIVPELDKQLKVEMYSNGIKYYQLRTTYAWVKSIGQDHVDGFNGSGETPFFGNVQIGEIAKAYQRAWFTVNLQGMSSRKKPYQQGSYNFTEVEALFYGALPILHSTAIKTALPKGTYAAVETADQIPSAVKTMIKSRQPLDPHRLREARDYVIDNHLATHHYAKLRKMF